MTKFHNQTTSRSADHVGKLLFVEVLKNIKGVKKSRNRPGVAQRVSGGLGSQIFMTFGT
jgi:hypothetical protein